MIRVWTDAAVSGNPGVAAIGIVMVVDGQQVIHKQVLESLMDNHEAELWAIVVALERLWQDRLFDQLIFIASDSKVAISAIEKNYIKQVHYRQPLQKIQELRNLFPQLYMKWVPEKDNRGADQLAKQALRQKI